MRDFEGKNAIVTGANRGIGLAVVKELVGRGCNIWAGTRQNSSNGVEQLSEISKEYNVRIESVYIEMQNEESIKGAFRKIYESKIPIDILVNVAGVVNADFFQMTSMAKIRNMFDVNLFGPMYLTQLVLKSMQRNRRGSIINVGSIAGMDANPANCAYRSSKAALMHFTRVLASEVGRSGIRVNAVAPGPTNTDMIRIVEDVVGEKEMLSRCALSRCAEPLEIAKVIAFLSSDDASFVNGQIIRIDGGSK